MLWVFSGNGDGPRSTVSPGCSVQCCGCFQETVTALGQQFYLDEKVDQEPEVWLPTALSLWHRNVRMTFMEGDTEHELDVQLLFPFKRKHELDIPAAEWDDYHRE